ncbi:MAG: BamA/TamA family outer membrane protein, partial [Pacificimonas sp.]
AGVITSAVSDLSAELPQRGYPFANVPEPRIVIDHETRTATLSLDVEPGPIGTYDGIRIVNEDAPFGARHVERLARFAPGDTYDGEDIQDLRRALIATGIVGNVSVDVVEAQPETDGQVPVDLALSIAPAPPRTLAAQIAFDTEDGLQLEGSWQHRNLFPPEGALTVTGIAGTEEQLLAVDLRRSNYKARDRAIGARLALFSEDRDAFFNRGISALAFLERETNLIWQKRWTYRLGPELLLTEERDRSRIVGGRASLETYYVAAFPMRLAYDGTDDLLDPTESFRLAGEVSPEVSFEGGTFGYARTQAEASTYMPLTEERDFVLAGRGLVASIAGSGRRNIAPSRRLYAGGGGSVRGFGFQDVGPEDADGDPLGGRSKVEGSLEARYRFGDFGAVGFVDVGQVYTDVTPTFQDLRVGVGIGGRYFTSFGPIRVDVATPLDRRPGEPRVAVYVSIGQSF